MLETAVNFLINSEGDIILNIDYCAVLLRTSGQIFLNDNPDVISFGTDERLSMNENTGSSYSIKHFRQL